MADTSTSGRSGVADTTTPAPTHRRLAFVLSAVGLVVTVNVLPAFLVGGLAVQIRQSLGLSLALLGGASAIFFGIGALTTRPLAAFTERVGPTRAMRFAAICAAACMLAAATAQSPLWLLIALCCAGIPNSLCQPAANELLMGLVPQTRRGLSFAVKQSAIPMSTLAAGLAVPTVALTLGWRWVFVFGATLALVAAAGVPRMEWRARPRHETREHPLTGWLLALLAITAGLGAAAATALGTFITVSAVEIGFDAAHAGLMLALGSAAGLSCRLGAGMLADRFRLDLLRTVMVMVAVGSVGFFLLSLGHPVAFVIGIVLGFGSGWAWQGIFNFAVAARFPERVAGATAVTQTGVYVGGAAGPLAFGVVAGGLGAPTAWLTGCGVMLLALVAVVAARRR